MHTHTARSAGLRPGRVLVFGVDDGLFALHIDWVEAMYPRNAVEIRHVRDEAGRQQPFLLHAGEPAMLVDLRDAFGLTALLGTTQRREVLVVRTPSFPLAVPADSCVGIRDLAFGERPPVPSSLVRDGGFAAGHLVALDGRPMAILDPAHLLDAAQRDTLAPLVEKARAFEERERRLKDLWEQICRQPTPAGLRSYARLCSRNGRSRHAVAARIVLRHVEAGRWRDPQIDGGSEAPADWEQAADAALAGVAASVPAHERLIRELVCLEAESATGELIVPQGDGAEEARVVVEAGLVVQAQYRSERGRAAFKLILAAHPEHFYFVETPATAVEHRISESTSSLIIATLASLGRERRARRPSLATESPQPAAH